jgi:hypothetical protein
MATVQSFGATFFAYVVTGIKEKYTNLNVYIICCNVIFIPSFFIYHILIQK